MQVMHTTLHTAIIVFERTPATICKSKVRVPLRSMSTETAINSMRSVRARFRIIPALGNPLLPQTIVPVPGARSKTGCRASSTFTTQAFPLTGFYRLLLDHPQVPSQHPAYYPAADVARDVVQPAHHPISNPPKPADPEDYLARAQLVFGSRLVGPLRVRTNDTNEQAQIIAGVLVPPKPKEPDNCCMSGCVNCVWDVFREDLEEWAAANARAQKALQSQAEGKLFCRVLGDNAAAPKGIPNGNHHHDKKLNQGQDISPGPSLWEGLEDIPIGIRVFMDTEKAIKSRKPDKEKFASASGAGD
ncbi:hypothetical protein TWF730_010783 [Orbilia blumenaviensis]|uniref:Oxidoreductase-like domain-containing protein n=1 Tax=Orbilia blumenaviensis TaxID=1796055 RepID=A0AAV9UQG5_9PEZI